MVEGDPGGGGVHEIGGAHCYWHFVGSTKGGSGGSENGIEGVGVGVLVGVIDGLSDCRTSY